MTFEPLYTATRVVTSSYRLVVTLVLFYYLLRRRKDGREFPRDRGARRLDQLP